MKPTLLILAAGLASRYGSLKQIDQFGPAGETIIDYAIYDAIRAGFGKVVFVIRRAIEEEFKEVFYGKFSGKITISYVLQETDRVPEGISVPEERVKPWGTAHAVMVAEEAIQEPFAVINADDFYGPRSFQLMADFLRYVTTDQECYGLVGYLLQNTLSAHGYVSRGICQTDEEDFLISLVERTHIYSREDNSIVYRDEEGKEVALSGMETVSLNLMGFTPAVFTHFRHYFSAFIQKNYSALKAEFYLPYVVHAIVQSQKAKVKVMRTPEKWFGVTYQADKVVAQERLRDLVAQGVYPENLWADANPKAV